MLLRPESGVEHALACHCGGTERKGKGNLRVHFLHTTSYIYLFLLIYLSSPSSVQWRIFDVFQSRKDIS
jgi:hypothetical protein